MGMINLHLLHGLDWHTADLGVALCMSDTDAGQWSSFDGESLDTIILDECDSHGYTYQRLQGRSIDAGRTYHGRYHAADVVWWALGPCSRLIVGALLFKVAGGPGTAQPLIWVPFSTPVQPDWSDFTIAWSPDGILTTEVGLPRPVPPRRSEERTRVIELDEYPEEVI